MKDYDLKLRNIHASQHWVAQIHFFVAFLIFSVLVGEKKIQENILNETKQRHWFPPDHMELAIPSNSGSRAETCQKLNFWKES
jgi:hypothetical protein